MDRQLKFTERNRANNRRNDNSLVVGSQKWTLHDLRRTGASIMQKLGITIEIIDLCQNHEIRNAVQKAYLQYDYFKEKAIAWKKLGKYLNNLLKDTEKSKIDV